MNDDEKIKQADNYRGRTDGAAQISYLILVTLIEIKELLRKKK